MIQMYFGKACKEYREEMNIKMCIRDRYRHLSEQMWT